MSHFLQRLALGIAGSPTSPRLRPLYGSIYAPSGPDTAGPAGSLAFEARETVAPLNLGHRAFQFAEETVASPGKASVESGSPPLPADRAARSSQPGSTLQPETSLAPESSNHAFSLLDIVSANRRVTAQSAGVQERPSAAGPQTPARHEEIVHGHEQALVRGGKPAAASAIARLPQTVGTQTAGPARLRADQPDEITIHIGRIEVAAIAQPQAPPVPAPRPHKSVNLDEYLRRGNGRAR